MKCYKTIEKTVYYISHCDVCGRKHEDYIWTDMGEMHDICFIGGYGSMIGDGYKVELDICDKCFISKLGQYIKIMNYQTNEDVKQEVVDKLGINVNPEA